MRKHQSVGEMISTCCFVGVSFYLLIYSLDLLESGEALRGYGGLLASALPTRFSSSTTMRAAARNRRKLIDSVLNSSGKFV